MDETHDTRLMSFTEDYVGLSQPDNFVGTQTEVLVVVHSFGDYAASTKLRVQYTPDPGDASFDQFYEHYNIGPSDKFMPGIGEMDGTRNLPITLDESNPDKDFGWFIIGVNGQQKLWDFMPHWIWLAAFDKLGKKFADVAPDLRKLQGIRGRFSRLPEKKTAYHDKINASTGEPNRIRNILQCVELMDSIPGEATPTSPAGTSSPPGEFDALILEVVVAQGSIGMGALVAAVMGKVKPAQKPVAMRVTADLNHLQSLGLTTTEADGVTTVSMPA